MPHSGAQDWRNGMLLASVALAAVLALAAAWVSALARVPQQRAAMERLLRAQTGLEVSYGRLVVRLGFYGPEAEFSNIEMHRPGAAQPLLRAPRMVARFESWRLLRGGQLRPGRVLVSGAEIDLRELAGLRRTAAPAAGPARPRPDGTPSAVEPASDAGLASLPALESRLARLLAGIPEGSLDFEAVTLLWSDPARPSEPLQLRAPHLYASRRVDGAQLSGTLLLPARFGRTLFVAAQLRGDAAAAGGLAGRVRLSGRGLVLSSWRPLGLVPDSVTGGSGDVALSVQLRDGRVQQADGELRLAGLGVVGDAPRIARRFDVAAADFDFARLPDDGWRWRLQRVDLLPAGVAAAPFRERGELEWSLARPAGRTEASRTLRLRRLPVEALALAATQGAAVAWPVMPELRIDGGEVAEFEARWGGSPAAASRRGRLEGLVLASADGQWRVTRLAAAIDGRGAHWRLRLEGPDCEVATPLFAPLPQAPRAGLEGEVEIATAPAGWSLAVRDLALRFAEGPRLSLRGSAGRDARDTASSRFELRLVEPLPRAAMALPQAATRDGLDPAFWEAFTAGQLQEASAELVDARLAGATAVLRDVSIAGGEHRPPASGVGIELAWDGRLLSGRLEGGAVGPLALEAGRLRWAGATTDRGGRSARAGLEVTASLAGPLEEALRLLDPDGALPGLRPGDVAGRVRVEARWHGASRGDGEAPDELEYLLDVEDGRWQPVAAAAALTALQGRLRADAGGLREGRLEGRWLEGPVTLRLAAAPRDELRISAEGQVGRAALGKQWSWLELVGRGRDDDLSWSAEIGPELEPRPGPVARRGAAGPATARGSAPWRVRLALERAARAEFVWTPTDAADGAWRLDRGVVGLGDAATLAGIPGALVVGGRLERLDLAGLADVLRHAAAGQGWQRPLVGEVQVADVTIGSTRLGEARLRLAGSRESTAVDLEGAALVGELRQAHAGTPGLQARFARLRLPEDAPLAALADAFLPVEATLEVQVADLRRGERSLGELTATFDADGRAVSTRNWRLRRGAQRLEASGRCEQATLACDAQFRLEDATLGELLQDLGYAPRVQGGEAQAAGRLAWSMRPGAGFAASLQGELEFGARLDAPLPSLAAAPSAEDASPGRADAAEDGRADAAPPTWPLLAPLLATVVQQRAVLAGDAAAATATASRPATPGSPPRGSGDAAATAAAFEPSLALERLDLRLAFRDGVATIERYEAFGRAARLSVAGTFDFREGVLDQQAEWLWIAPGVAGAVDRLDPRTPLATGLRALRDLLAARGAERSAATRDAGGTRPGVPVRFALDGPLQQPRIGAVPLLDSGR